MSGAYWGSWTRITIQTSNTVEKNENETLVYNVLKKKKGEVLFDVLQSEEGGRFFCEENRNIIIKTNIEELAKILSENYMILDYEEIINMTRCGGIVNVQLRSLMSCLTTLKI